MATKRDESKAIKLLWDLMIEGRKAILSKMLISDRTWRGQAIKYKINGNPKAK